MRPARSDDRRSYSVVFFVEGFVMKRDLLTTKTPEQERQLEMARNVAHLKGKRSKQQQVHLLCTSLVKMIKGK